MTVGAVSVSLSVLKGQRVAGVDARQQLSAHTATQSPLPWDREKTEERQEDSWSEVKTV